MNTDSIIDRVLVDVLGLNAGDSYVLTEWRPRLLIELQTVVTIVLHDGTAWDFMQASGTCTLSSGSGQLPADFGRFPPESNVGGVASGVYVQGQARKLTYRPPGVVLAARRLRPSAGGFPDIYTVRGFNSTTGRMLIECYPTDNSILELDYQKKRPQLVDSSSAGNGMDSIPDEYHENVFYQGLCEYAAGSVSDPRGPADFSIKFQRSYNLMKLERSASPGEVDNRMGDYGAGQLGMW